MVRNQLAESRSTSAVGNSSTLHQAVEIALVLHRLLSAIARKCMARDAYGCGPWGERKLYIVIMRQHEKLELSLEPTTASLDVGQRCSTT